MTTEIPAAMNIPGPRRRLRRMELITHLCGVSYRLRRISLQGYRLGIH